MLTGFIQKWLHNSELPGFIRVHSSTERPRTLSREGLHEIGVALSEDHKNSKPGGRSRLLYRKIRENIVKLERAHGVLLEAAANEEPLTPGVEWFLDNYHIIEKHILDVKKHFPKSYDRTLPKVQSGFYHDFPRVYPLAVEFLFNTDSVLDQSLLTSFLDGYRSVTTLTIGEFWAIPIMLRLGLLENLVTLTSTMLKVMNARNSADQAIDEIVGDESRAGTDIMLSLAEKIIERPDFLDVGAGNLVRRLRDRGPRASLTLQWLEERLREQGREPEEVLRSEQYFLAADQISIANVVTSLRTINFISWKDWFERNCQVELEMQKEPTGLYLKEDFYTRDECRHVVERLSRGSGKTEMQVVEEAFHLAKIAQISEAPESQNERIAWEKTHYLEYYLLGRGRETLENVVGYRVPVLRAMGRFIKKNSFAAYSTGITIFSLIILYYIVAYTVASGGGIVASVLAALIFFIPATDIANNIVQSVITHIATPKILPKFSFEEGIPDGMKTAVIVHTLFGDQEAIRRTVEALHVRFLANDEPNLMFGILADFKDAEAAVTKKDQSLIEFAEELINELNQNDSHRRFFVLFRHRLWNESEGCFMAWERKRGKIEEFNRLILGDDSTTFMISDEDLKSRLRECRYVITLDNDSQLPRGTARKLVGVMAHPLNRPVFNEERRIVVDGYGLIQPRVGVSLTSAHASLFAQTFSGHSGLDPYTQSVSDVYQDLFDEASYIGKGIYDVKAFHDALDGRVPENSLLSHDLIEGLFVRCGLASDIELFDDFPSKYHVHARRQHRWTRGDWQLLPWTGVKIPDARKQKKPTPLSNLSRWKLVDNLRRSLVAPSLFVGMIASWFFLPGSALMWTLAVLTVIAFPVYANLAQALIIPSVGQSLTSHVRGVGKDMIKMSKQAFLTFTFLPHQAWLMVHAIAVTIYRLRVTKKHFLEWETAHASEKRLKASLENFTREMMPALTLTLILAALLLGVHSEKAGYALPVMILWGISPWVALELSRPRAFRVVQLGSETKEYLTKVAYDTWRYFRHFMNERNNFLVPDNVQMTTGQVVAERTSPTNISLSILSTVSAFDLGFSSISKTLERLERTYNSLNKLERYNGHFLNWYSTTDLQALYPRYVSTVDSGNFLGHMVAVKSAMEDMELMPLLTDKHVHGISLLIKELKTHSSLAGRELETPLIKSENDIVHFALELKTLVDRINIPSDSLASDFITDCKKELIGFAEVGNLIQWVTLCREICKIIDKIDVYQAEKLEIESILSEINFHSCSLAGLLKAVDQIIVICGKLKESEDKVRSISENILSEAKKSKDHILGLIATIDDLKRRSEAFIESIDFSFLYDFEKDLFFIGYNVDLARRDQSYYDLLASEARIGSFVSIAMDQVPQKHWFALGRGLADTSGGKALLSWSGTMFEYLMPLLIMKDYPQTLLSESNIAMVRAQEIYGQGYGVPWGISESGYSGVDFEKTYQYKAFGVPGLGLKRGLDDDLVISPYSSFLALLVSPQRSFENIRRLEDEGARGEYGFFEALDYSPSRLGEGEEKHIVRSFLAHHQGMSFIAINNLLNNGIFQDRFHKDLRVKACELLLHERFPDRLPTISAGETAAKPLPTKQGEQESLITLVLNTPHTAMPRTQLLSNGRYTVMIDNAGGGFSSFDQELFLTRWREDAVSSMWGTFIFIRDLESGEVWSATFQPTLKDPEGYEVVFSPDKIEFKRRDWSIFSHLEVTISPEENVEVRKLSLANLGRKRRVLEITSYAEIAMSAPRADSAHPSFSKMFIESEFINDLDALLFSRRPRSRSEEKLYFMHLVTMRRVWDRVRYETSKNAFIGRGNTIHSPAALRLGAELSGTIGAVLDPVASLRVTVELQPGETEFVTFVSGVSRDKSEILTMASKFRDFHQVSRAFEISWSQASVELRNERISARQAQTFQRLGNILLYNSEKARGKPDVIMRNCLGQSGLWRFGISGDVPIALVRITEPDQTKLVQELLRAHYYLRIRGFQFDLVILNEYPGGYLQNFQEELDLTIRASLSGGLIDKKGGVYLRTATQISDQEKDLLQSVARIVLSGLRGSLGSQLRIDESISPWLPFRPWGNEPRGSTEALEIPPLEFNNGLGGFSDNGKSYCMAIKGDNIPPLPWSNVIASEDFGFLVTELNGGFTWSENSRENRLSPWSNDSVSDPAGEAIFIRNTRSGTYWCPTPRPMPSERPFLVRHEFGLTAFQSEFNSIKSDLKLSLNKNKREKLFQLDLVNTSQRQQKIEIVFYVEWVLGVIREESYRYIVTGYDRESGVLYATNQYNNEFAGRVVYIGSSEPVLTYTTQRSEFVGRNRDLSSPICLDSALSSELRPQANPLRFSKKVGGGFDSCGALVVNLSIEPGKSESVTFFMGEAPSISELSKLVPRNLTQSVFKQQINQTQEWHNEFAGQINVTTPDRSFDILMNGWLLYQTESCRMFARTGFYQSGGAIGFRDQLQDSLAFLYFKPEIVKDQILLHASRQFVEGDVQHWWHPPTGRGVRTRFSDDFLWLPYAVLRYLEVTGDCSILDMEVPFISAPSLQEHEMESYVVPTSAERKASLYEHCLLAVERGLRYGVHNLPLIGCGDWNDGMNEVGREGRGESVWLGWFQHLIFSGFIPIIEKREDWERADKLKAYIARLKTALEEHGWDGSWYRRAFFDDGSPLGSAVNSECRIDSISQSWSVISGVGDKERTVSAMNEVYRQLVDEGGRVIRLLTPPFKDGHLEPGYIKGYLPGIRENGAQYTHAAAWAIIATCMLGKGDKAMQLFNMINPINLSATADGVSRYKGEPYILCGDVYSVPPHVGRAGWSWYTGSAGWMFQAGLEYILGLKVKPTGFSISPCVPKSWNGFSLSFSKENTTYNINIENTSGLETGNTRLLIDGVEVSDGFVEFSKIGSRKSVDVVAIMY